MKKFLLVLLVVGVLFTGCSVVVVALAGSGGPVITESSMGKCLEAQGMKPWDASDGDVTVTYRQPGKTSIDLTVLGEDVVYPQDEGDLRLVVLRGCDR